MAESQVDEAGRQGSAGLPRARRRGRRRFAGRTGKYVSPESGPTAVRQPSTRTSVPPPGVGRYGGGRRARHRASSRGGQGVAGAIAGSRGMGETTRTGWRRRARYRTARAVRATRHPTDVTTTKVCTAGAGHRALPAPPHHRDAGAEERERPPVAGLGGTTVSSAPNVITSKQDAATADHVRQRTEDQQRRDHRDAVDAEQGRHGQRGEPELLPYNR